MWSISADVGFYDIIVELTIDIIIKSKIIDIQHVEWHLDVLS